MAPGKVNYLRFNLRSDFLSALRLRRAALVDGESKIHRRMAAKIIITIKPESPCRKRPLFIPPSMHKYYF